MFIANKSNNGYEWFDDYSAKLNFPFITKTVSKVVCLRIEMGRIYAEKCIMFPLGNQQ